MQGFLGVIFFLAVASLFSEDRRAFPSKLAIVCLISQFFIAAAFLNVAPLQGLFSQISLFVKLIEDSSLYGAKFVFGYLSGAVFPAEPDNPDNLFIVAFRVMPIIVFVSALSSLLFHIGIIPVIIRALSKVLRKTFGLNGALAFGLSASLFLGTIEAPLTIKSYLSRLSKSDLFLLITASMSTISGGVLVLYASVLNKVLDDAAAHLVVASIMSLPAAILISRIMVPSALTDDFKEPTLSLSDIIILWKLSLREPKKVASWLST